jgi:nucleotide sugar dehydrogenase
VLRAACASVVRHARAGQTIVLTSTTYVGTTRELLVEPLAERGMIAGEDVFVAFAPERIDPGVPDHEQLQTPRVLGAVSETCYRRAAEILRHTCRNLHRVSSPEAAEMVKLYENTFRAVNIAFAFEMAEACRAHGLDPIEVTDGAATKPFGFMAHYPSAGVGGHCIGVDPHYLLHPLRELGRPATIAEEAMRKVAGRPRHVVWRAHEVLVESGTQLCGAHVLVVGVAYKPSVADSRQAPALEIIERLREEGAHVHYHDPHVPHVRVEGEVLYGVDPDPRRDASGFGPADFDLAILVTVHPEHDYGWLARCRAVLDCTYRTPAGQLRFVP